MKKAFTMMELVFVIVILGILAAIALPRLWVTRDDAIIAKAKTQIANIKAGISTAYSKNIMAGNIDVCPSLEKSTTDNELFENIITPPITANSGNIKWQLENNDSHEFNYTLTVGKYKVRFTYDLNNTQGNCPFECNDSSSPLCK